jgi:hypothetical protein
MLRKISEPKQDEVSEQLKELHKNELRNFYRSYRFNGSEM